MKNVRLPTLLALLGAAVVPAACSGSGSGNVNIGNTAVVGSQLSDYVATWDGYAEAYTFMPDGSDRVRLTISSSGQGTFQVGNAALLPAPTDPNVGYPSPGQPTSTTEGAMESTLAGGVLYPIYAARVQENRIQAGMKPSDYYAAWCALQTPYYVLTGFMTSGVAPDGGLGDAGALSPTYAYRCVPGFGGGSSIVGGVEQCYAQGSSLDGGYTDTPEDCGKFALCDGNICACTATSCTTFPTMDPAAIPSDYLSELDAALDSTGKTLTGTLVMRPLSQSGNSSDVRVTVVLTRQ
ncbi:MAG TPA: hypothetical protein VKZ18_21460 [Polyangia bacterium]|nr:hypothetical protein [Polyangia bacterium]